ncbi:hypothetical protein BAE44_0021235 [Dichanthelium oligosanthes]|uniref:Uncharacterized protein n=1 Tax=Dichanthelium oligosanthes TaxID=888268 RepID=A0A1E5UXY1_9POAL|nr:hypothetical protein BAE44_0021235 [Dichanthelium oligosanthes]
MSCTTSRPPTRPGWRRGCEGTRRTCSPRPRRRSNCRTRRSSCSTRDIPSPARADLLEFLVTSCC